MASKKYGDEFGEDEFTPIGATPIETIEHRSKTTATDTRATLLTMNVVRDELRAAITRDEVEHKRLNEGLNSLRRQHDTTNERLDQMTGRLAAVSEMAAVADAKLDLIVDDVRAAKKLSVHREKITIETAAVVERAQVEDAADEKRQQRARNVKILSILGGVLGTGGIASAIIASLLGKC